MDLTLTINISHRLIEEYKHDRLFMEMLALFVIVKFTFAASRIRFKTQKELIRRLRIGHSKFMAMKRHPMFDYLFRLTKDTLVAKRLHVDGVQLSLGLWKSKLKNDRILIKIKKEELSDYEKVLDRILEALFVNLVRNCEARLHGGEPGSPTSDKKEVGRFMGLMDSTISNKIIAKYLNVKVTKEKEITSMAVKDKLVKKFINVQVVAYTNDPYDFIEKNKDKYRQGALIPGPGHKCVLWQIPNTWKLAHKGAHNRTYFGGIHLDKKESKPLPLREDDGFFLKDNTAILNFLDVDEVVTEDGEILGICPKKNKEQLARELAVKMAKEEYKEVWEGLEPRNKSKIIRTYFKAILSEAKHENFLKYIRHLKKSNLKVEVWKEDKLSEVQKQMEDAKAACDEAGTSIASIGGMIERRLDRYNNEVNPKASFDSVRELFAEMAGELANAVWMVNEDVWTLYRSNEFLEKLDCLDVRDRKRFENTPTDEELTDEWLDMMKDIPLEDLIKLESNKEGISLGNGTKVSCANVEDLSFGKENDGMINEVIKDSVKRIDDNTIVINSSTDDIISLRIKLNNRFNRENNKVKDINVDEQCLSDSSTVYPRLTMGSETGCSPVVAFGI